MSALGPSEDYKALLRGEITSGEYVKRMKADVDASRRDSDLSDRRAITRKPGLGITVMRIRRLPRSRWFWFRLNIGFGRRGLYVERY